MEMKDRLAAHLDKSISQNWYRLAEIRIRANRPARYRCIDGKELSGPVTDAQQVRKIVHMLMENSVYACEEELKEGYFTADGGCRVGVCGKMSVCSGKVIALNGIASACIRIPREKKGCADQLAVLNCGSILILSVPGLGKTTLLRDFARQISDGGENVAIADERREIAACREGVPSLDVGCRTDVLDGCPKAMAIPMLVRACAPDWIIADEIGGEQDAEALRDAARCGVKIAATAHAANVEEAMLRRHVGALIEDGIFEYAAVLSGSLGHIAEIRKLIRGVET